MASPPWSRITGFFRELKRRKVYQVTALYVVLGVAGLEALDLLVPATRLPPWTTPFFVSLAIVGLPLVIVFAWTFDITPGGVVRTPEDEGEVAEADTSGRPAPDPRRDRPMPGAAGEGGSETLDPHTVAVLPFENLSASEEAEPFSAGLHDDLLTELSRASALTVISRTSVRGYRGTAKSLRQVARELGAGTIVEGGVQKAGDRVRLNVQVIDARNDSHRWAERYDRELTAENIFDLQSELASHIMGALEARLTSAERARIKENPTDDLEAYRLYAIGRELHVDRSEEGMRRASSYFRKALERDPDYAPAWAGLGMTLVALVDYGHVDEDATLEEGIAACEKALELDPGLPEAHAVMGTVRTYQRDGRRALESLRRAVELGPGLSLGHQWTSWVELLVGDGPGALEAARRATDLDPLDPEARGNLAMALLAVGRVERAEAEARRALEPHPDFAYGRWVRGLALIQSGRRTRGIGELERLEQGQFRPWGTMARGLAGIERGDEERAGGARKELAGRGAWFKVGMLRAAEGERDAAFEAFRRAAPLFWDDALVLRYFRGEPLGALRPDPRFAAIVEDLDRSWGMT